MQAKELTARQSQILNFIKSFTATNGFPPTVRDIGKAMHIRSPNGVICHLRALEKKGVIDRMGGVSRAIRIIGGQRRILAVVRNGITDYFVIDDNFNLTDERTAYRKARKSPPDNGEPHCRYFHQWLEHRGLQRAGRDMIVEIEDEG